jgi:hypothetical protein
MNKKSKTLKKLKERKCKNCGEIYSGRSNQLYCSHECRDDFNNRKDTIMRKDSRKYGRIMEKNLRIIKRYLKEHSGPCIRKKDLREMGFNFFGPFQVNKIDAGYELILAPYIFLEYPDHYDLRRTLTPNIDGTYTYRPG